MRIGFIALGSLVLLLTWPGYPIAQRSIYIETVHSTTPNGKPAAALVVNGVTVAQLAKAQRERSPIRIISDAAALVAEAYRLGEARLTVKQTDDSGRRFALFLNGVLMLVATDQEGKAWGAAPEELANTWRENLLKAWDLEVPAPVTASSADTPSVSSAEANTPPTPSTAGTATQGTQTARSAPASTNLATSTGHHVHTPPEHTTISTPVIPAELTAKITGSALSRGEAVQSIDSAIRSHAGLPADASLTWQVSSPAGVDLRLKPGQQKQLTIDYAVSGAGHATTRGQVRVQLENQAIAVPRESLTFFSNRPETVSGAQLLYYADLPDRKSGRLVFHHQNRGGSDLQFVARLLNESSTQAAVHVVAGLCDPDINTFYVGFRSAERFWHNLNAGNGYVLNIPPQGQVYLTSQYLPRGNTTSGYLKLSNLSDASLRVETLTLTPGASTPLTRMPVGNASNAVYGPPYVSHTAVHSVGDPWLYLRLGEHDGSDNQLDGCYGMTHSFDVELRNPRDNPALVFVVLRASAGEVKGQFFINDEYVATPLVAGGNEQLLKEVPLKPGQVKLLKIRAIPLNGGFYPASIILRQTRYP